MINEPRTLEELKDFAETEFDSIKADFLAQIKSGGVPEDHPEVVEIIDIMSKFKKSIHESTTFEELETCIKLCLNTCGSILGFDMVSKKVNA